MGNRFL